MAAASRPEMAAAPHPEMASAAVGGVGAGGGAVARVRCTRRASGCACSPAAAEEAHARRNVRYCLVRAWTACIKNRRTACARHRRMTAGAIKPAGLADW
eukprot:scaffold2297_cov102-Isochrysis_galbana.AAC.5